MEKEMLKIDQLKVKIELQRKHNVEIFRTIPVASHEDPLNLKAKPILAAWRVGSNRLKIMLNELAELELASKATVSNPESKTFVNGFGEATKRNITCSAYKKAESCTKKAIFSFII